MRNIQLDINIKQRFIHPIKLHNIIILSHLHDKLLNLILMQSGKLRFAILTIINRCVRKDTLSNTKPTMIALFVFITFTDYLA